MSFLGGFIKFITGAVLVGVGALLGSPFLEKFGLGLAFSGLGEAISDPGQQQAALEANSVDTQSPLPVVYGRAKLGLRLVDMRVGGDNNKYLYIVGALCHGSSDGTGIEAIDEIYFNERKAFDADPTGNAESWLSGKAYIEKHRGTDAQDISAGIMGTTFPTDWPSTSKGRGVAALVVRLEYDAEIFGTGIPNITAIVRGGKVKDPRNLAADAAYSTNPACCLYDYLTSTRYGLRAPAGDINTASLAEMADYYDEEVEPPATGWWAQAFALWSWFTGATYPRYAINTVLDVSQSPKANIQQLLSGCRGNLVYQGGQYRLFTRRPVTPTSFTLSEDNLVGGLKIQTIGTAACPNSIRYTYVEPGVEETTDGVIYAPPFAAVTQFYPRPGESNPFLDEDNGFEVVQDLQLPATSPPYMAERIALETLQELRGISPAGALTVQCVATQAALQLQVGDVVPLTHATPGWTAKPFWVMAIGSLGRGLVGLSLLEYNEAAYTIGDPTSFAPRPATNLPNPFTCAPPTDLVLTSDETTTVRTVDGSAQAAIRATWTASVDPYVDYYEVEAKRSMDTAYLPVATTSRDTTEAIVSPVTAFEPWDVRVRAVNTLGTSSVWVTASTTTETDEPAADTPPALTSATSPVDLFTGATLPIGFKNIPADRTPLIIGRGPETKFPLDGFKAVRLVASIAASTAPVGAYLSADFEAAEVPGLWGAMDGDLGPSIPIDPDSLDALDTNPDETAWVVAGDWVAIREEALADVRVRAVVGGGDDSGYVIVTAIGLDVRTLAATGQSEQTSSPPSDDPGSCDTPGSLDAFAYADLTALDAAWPED